ncbi:MAG: YqiA/YcfP family alpha/beta fold hydrolase [Tolumonas sp.]
MSPTLIYLHGFNSTPNSVKARQMTEYLAAELPDIQVCVPKLPNTPAASWQAIQDTLAALGERKIGLVGSSMGGFWAAKVAEVYGHKAVVVNPAVHPHYLLQQLLGTQRNPYTGEEYLLEPHHVEELRALDIPVLQHPERIWLLQQQGDEVLDYRHALQFYHFARTTVEQGGNHAFTGFERYCAQIVRFLQL